MNLNDLYEMRDPRDAYQRDVDNSRVGMNRQSRADVTGEEEPSGVFTVVIDGKPWKTGSSNEMFALAGRIANKHTDKKVSVKWPTGELNTVRPQGMAEGEENKYGSQENWDSLKKDIRSQYPYKKGTIVTVPHKGKLVNGKIVRYEAGGGGYSPAYVVDIGEYESIMVEPNKVRQEVDEGSGAKWRNHPDAYEPDRSDELDRPGAIQPKGGYGNDELKGRPYSWNEKGKVTPGATARKKASIKSSLGKHHKANLPEQGVAEGDVDSDGYSMDHADSGEYDYEGDQARDQINTIVRAARRLDGMLDDNENMPEWVQMKVTLAADYLDTAADYIESNQEPELEEGERGRGRPPTGQQDTTPVTPGRVEKTATGIRHHADSSRYGGTEPDEEDDRLMSKSHISRLGKMTEPDIDEGEKVGNMDADAFDAAMARLKQLAGAGPLKTVWDPTKRVYRNVPVAVQPKK